MGPPGPVTRLPLPLFRWCCLLKQSVDKACRQQPEPPSNGGSLLCRGNPLNRNLGSVVFIFNGYNGCFVGSKAAGLWSWSLINPVLRLRMCGVVPPRPYIPSGRAQRTVTLLRFITAFRIKWMTKMNAFCSFSFLYSFPSCLFQKTINIFQTGSFVCLSVVLL